MKNKRLYNYLVNTYGLSQKKINSEITSRVDKVSRIIRKSIDAQVVDYLESRNFEYILVDRVSLYLSGKKQAYWTNIKSRIEVLISDKVNDIISEKINQTLEKSFTLDVKVSENAKTNKIKVRRVKLNT